MIDRLTPRLLLTLALLTAALLLPWGPLLGDSQNTKLLGGEERYLTFLSTDKPIYRQGETVYIRGVLLHHRQRTPRPAAGRAEVTIVGPKGSAVSRGNARLQDSVLGTTWNIPGGMAGGQYTIKVRHHDGQPPAERSFEIRAFRAPRLNSQIVFLRKGYGPGDEAAATLAVKRAEGGVPAGAAVSATARVDGRVAWRGKATLDARGFCTVRFRLPAKIVHGEGTLALVISDGGIVETAAQTIPILLRKIDLAAYPEGGDLVAGLDSRVYLEARTPWGKPADVAGRIVDAQGRVVAAFRTVHEGRARCAFRPAAGESYTARITEPAGIDPVALPAVRPAGGTIAANSDVTPKDAPVSVRVAHTTAGKYAVTLASREVELSRSELILAARQPVRVTLDPRRADGVLRVTLWDVAGQPVAERLVYRQPARQLRIQVMPDRARYVPGSAVTLTVKTTDGAGQPIGAVVGLTVTDERTGELIEQRERAPRLPVMVLLEGEVRELADARIYLDPTNADAPRALDLLLGTQGWRRFAFVDPVRFATQHGDAGRRVLALKQERNWKWNRRLFKQSKSKPQPATPRTAKAPRPLSDKKVAEKRQELSEELSKERAAELQDLRIGGGRYLRQIAWIELPVVREYAHHVRKDRRPGDRVDFAETLYWHAGIKTDATTGTARVTFSLSDSVTRFAVQADGFGAGGALAQADAVIESVEPFYIAPKLPLEVTAGDVIQVPVGLVNGTGDPLEVRLTATSSGLGLRIAGVGPVKLAPGERGRVLVTIAVESGNGPASIRFAAQAGPYADQVTRPLQVAPLGFPAEIARAGTLPAGGEASHEITVPADLVPHSMRTEVVAYPSPLANLTQALQALIREPYG